MSYIDDEELKIDIGDEEDEDTEEELESPVDDEIEEDDSDLLSDEFKGLDEIMS